MEHCGQKTPRRLVYVYNFAGSIRNPVALNIVYHSMTYCAVADPGENLTGALHSKFGRGGCRGRGLHGHWIYAMMLLSKTQ